MGTSAGRAMVIEALVSPPSSWRNKACSAGMVRRKVMWLVQVESAATVKLWVRACTSLSKEAVAPRPAPGAAGSRMNSPWARSSTTRPGWVRVRATRSLTARPESAAVVSATAPRSICPPLSRLRKARPAITTMNRMTRPSSRPQPIRVFLRQPRGLAMGWTFLGWGRKQPGLYGSGARGLQACPDGSRLTAGVRA